jgi:branched-chain amino acid transport system permease protein
LAQQLLNAIFIGSIYALFAVGYTLVFGILDVLNLAHSAVFMLGAVFAYSLVVLHHQPYWLAGLLAVLLSGALGLVIEFTALRPLRRRSAPPISALISTIGLALIGVALVEQANTPNGLFSWLWVDGSNSVRIPTGLYPNATYHLAGLTLETSKMVVLVVAIVLMLVLGYLMRYTQLGRALRAVAENPRAAQLMGININQVFALTLVLSSALGGLAGILFGIALSNVGPYIGRDQVEVKGLAVIVLGGMGSIPGAVVGGYVLGIIEAFTFVTLGSNVEAGVAFAALFGMLVLRPQGFFGARLRERI